jgi:hypothetical protein
VRGELKERILNFRVTETEGGVRWLERWDPQLGAWIDTDQDEAIEPLIELMAQIYAREGVTDFA